MSQVIPNSFSARGFASVALFLASILCLPGESRAGASPPVTELLINEILYNDPNGGDAPNEYVELRGTPGGEIPSGTYLVGVEGDNSAGTMGRLNFIFSLGGITMGSDGFLVIFMDNHPYSADAGSATVTGNMMNGFEGAAGFDTSGLNHIEEGSTSFFLVEAPNAPLTSDGIDGSDGGSDGDGIPTGAEYDSWTILDSISIVDNLTGSGADLLNAGHSPHIIFATDPDAGDFLANPAATVVDLDGIVPNYIARLGNSTGTEENDWVVAELDGSAPNFTLATGGTVPGALEGNALNHIGRENFFLCPDNQVGKKASSLKGDDVYNTTGAGQKLTLKVTKRKTMKFFFKIENDGDIADSMTVSGLKGNSLFDTKYFVDGEGNQTAAIVAGTYTADLASAAMTTGKVKVKPTKKTEKTGKSDLLKKKRNYTLRIDSAIDQSEADLVKFTAKTK